MYFYVKDDKGKRIPCLHPGEGGTVIEVLGENASIELIKARTGYHSHCVCLDCLHQFDLDLGEEDWPPLFMRDSDTSGRMKDKRQCPNCKSGNVKTVLESVGQICPKCKKGIIEETWTGCIS